MFIRVDQWWDSVISNAKITATYKYEEQHDGRMLGGHTRSWKFCSNAKAKCNYLN